MTQQHAQKQFYFSFLYVSLYNDSVLSCLIYAASNFATVVNWKRRTETNLDVFKVVSHNFQVDLKETLNPISQVNRSPG
jgi:hypothetical protein